jgi:hypothetical protein
MKLKNIEDRLTYVRFPPPPSVPTESQQKIGGELRGYLEDDLNEKTNVTVVYRANDVINLKVHLRQKIIVFALSNFDWKQTRCMP